MVSKIFLESHNIKNLHFGFGQFNYHLIKGLFNAQAKDLKITLHAKNIKLLQSKYSSYFNYKIYYSLRRHRLFQIKKKYNVWHSLNQNIKIEPYYNIPYLLTVHDVNFIDEISCDLNHKINVRFQNKLNRSKAITYISEYAKRSTHQYFDVPNVPEYIIYNGNPITNTILPKAYIPKRITKRPFLFSIGEFTERKNFHTLVEMLNYLPNFDLVLSGNNNTKYTQETLINTIEKLKLKKRVYITGRISDIDKQYYLQNCTAFVFPSLREGFGIPPIEAMRFGKPVFLSNNTSLPEIGGKYAFYWNDYDAKNMAKTLENGMHKFETQKPSYKKAYVERAKSFNWDDAAKQYIDVYRSLL